MSRSAQLDRSYQRIFWAALGLSALAHGLILLSTRWSPGILGPETHLREWSRSESDQLRLVEERLSEPPLELIALSTVPDARTRSPVPPPAPIASVPTPTAVSTEVSGPQPQSDAVSESTASREPARPALTYVPLPAAVLVLAGGVVIPALADLDLEEVLKGEATGPAVALYQKGSVMNAKDAWVAAAGGRRSADEGINVVFEVGSGICPVRPKRGTFKLLRHPSIGTGIHPST